MKAVLMDEFGAPEVMKIGEIDKPQPKTSEVLIKVVASSINRPDLVQRVGNYPPPAGDSEILGLEVAGTVAEIGSDVSNWKVGDRVMALVGGGGYAEYAVAFA
nr:alcohol dehydrogenase catalytic domain-containing protein [Desulfuromusa sp.]